jgi:hypothetical protein
MPPQPPPTLPLPCSHCGRARDHPGQVVAVSSEKLDPQSKSNPIFPPSAALSELTSRPSLTPKHSHTQHGRYAFVASWFPFPPSLALFPLPVPLSTLTTLVSLTTRRPLPPSRTVSGASQSSHQPDLLAGIPAQSCCRVDQPRLSQHSHGELGRPTLTLDDDRQHHPSSNPYHNDSTRQVNTTDNDDDDCTNHPRHKFCVAAWLQLSRLAHFRFSRQPASCGLGLLAVGATAQHCRQLRIQLL